MQGFFLTKAVVWSSRFTYNYPINTIKGECTLDRKLLQKNIDSIFEKINENKQSDTPVELIAVSKYVESDVIREMVESGLSKFAENRTDSLLKKQEELGELNNDIAWHFVGRLQTRPVRKMINLIDYLHSLDRMSLIKEVDKRAEKPVKCFLQVNISGEEQKAGFKPEEVLSTVEQLEDYPNIHLVGLMTMAPHDESEERLRDYFRALKDLQVEVSSMNLEYAPCTELSMGMSEDYPIAIQEGATMVRVGRALIES